MIKRLGIFFILFFILGANPLKGAEILSDTVTSFKGRVNEIVSVENVILPGIDVPVDRQVLRILITSGDEKGSLVTVENDYSPFNIGDRVYISKNISGTDGLVTYSLSDADRTGLLLGLSIVFIFLIIWIGRSQGLRGFATLVGSLALIVFVFIPGILSGISPVFLSLVVSGVVVIVGSYVTHGFNRTTTSAVFGMLVTIFITGILAIVSVYGGNMTGLSSDEATYLMLNVKGTIDMQGLLLGGILIGLLGLLYDVAIGQAIAVEEISRAGKDMSKKDVYRRAMRVGREHIGALVDTLAIVYVGAALPLLLLFFSGSAVGGQGIVEILNREIFAEEIVRILVGSIGLMLAVPITTWISVLRYSKDNDNNLEQGHIHHHHVH